MQLKSVLFKKEKFVVLAANFWVLNAKFRTNSMRISRGAKALHLAKRDQMNIVAWRYNALSFVSVVVKKSR